MFLGLLLMVLHLSIRLKVEVVPSCQEYHMEVATNASTLTLVFSYPFK